MEAGGNHKATGFRDLDSFSEKTYFEHKETSENISDKNIRKGYYESF